MIKRPVAKKFFSLPEKRFGQSPGLLRVILKPASGSNNFA
jgi:hypothetical protein